MERGRDRQRRKGDMHGEKWTGREGERRRRKGRKLWAWGGEGAKKRVVCWTGHQEQKTQVRRRVRGEGEGGTFTTLNMICIRLSYLFPVTSQPIADMTTSL